MNRLYALMLMVLLWWPAEAYAEEYGKYDFPNVCRPTSIVSEFSAAKSSYKFAGTCLLNIFPYRWTAEGAYNTKDGLVQERILIADDEGHQGEIRNSMTCNLDPWLGRAICTNVRPASQGNLAFYVNLHPHLENFQSFILSRKNPLTTSLSYDRGPLRLKRSADLKAEAAAALARTNKRILKGVTQVPAVVFPTVQLPTPGQRFLNQTAVPIKLAPPKGWVETQVGLDGRPVTTNRLYMVRIERKDAAGNWVSHTTLPVGAPQAESATGYTGFGAGAPPGGTTSPGSWRMSAQMSSPTQTGWSDWVEFVVMAPPTKTQVQRAPKMFGQ